MIHFACMFAMYCHNKNNFISGAHIILSMKIISLGIDIGEEGSVLNLPNIVEYMGYCFNVGSVVFGPWVSYRQYCQLLEKESNPLASNIYHFYPIKIVILMINIGIYPKVNFSFAQY